MPIKYVLAQSRLRSTPPDAHVARVLRSSTAELEDVIAVMTQQGCTIFKADVLSVLEAYHSAIESLLREGRNVNTPGVSYRVALGGVFTGSDDAFDPARHQVRVHARPGKRTLQALEHAAWEKVEANKPLPHPEHYTDVASGKRDAVLTPGGVGEISGFRLRFDPADPLQGVFFVAPTGAATRAETMVRNRLRELMLVVPALPAGTYTLEVRARINSTDDLRSGALEYPLTVS
jgi:hypothetical protein